VRQRDQRRTGPRRVSRAVGHAVDVVAHVASIAWRSLFGTAAALCAVAGLLLAFGRGADSYGFILVAMLVATIATCAAVLALRVETDPDPYDLEVTP
jgi:uncharacterized membrane protein